MKVSLPPIVFGSSALGNLYEVVPEETKRAIVRQWLDTVSNPVLDSAGKYGAGLALECMGRLLEEAEVDPDSILISNKLGWKQVPLTTPEPTFEPGAWFGLEHDAEQSMGAAGILDAYHQGNELLGAYSAKLVSVHDPDEYLAAAVDEEEAAARYEEIREAYRALNTLKDQGEVLGVGIGSKDWRVIKRLFEDGILFDWVMFANSLTLYSHPSEMLAFMAQLHAAEIPMINSAVFNAGFLVGGPYFDYQVISEQTHPEVFDWRRRFLAACDRHKVQPAHACCQFSLSPPGVKSLALNTSKPEHVPRNVEYVTRPLPQAFWADLKTDGLLSSDYLHV